jgi:hypothetical protein
MGRACSSLRRYVNIREQGRIAPMDRHVPLHRYVNIRKDRADGQACSSTSPAQPRRWPSGAMRRPLFQVVGQHRGAKRHSPAAKAQPAKFPTPPAAH